MLDVLSGFKFVNEEKKTCSCEVGIISIRTRFAVNIIVVIIFVFFWCIHNNGISELKIPKHLEQSSEPIPFRINLVWIPQYMWHSAYKSYTKNSTLAQSSSSEFRIFSNIKLHNLSSLCNIQNFRNWELHHVMTVWRKKILQVFNFHSV